ncbi:MAG: phosphatidate cytidylyltransferase [Bacteroidia bacterium]
MKDLGLRLATGVVFLTLVIGSILLVNTTVIPFLVFFSLTTAIGLWEFYRICENEKIYVQKRHGIFVGTGIFFITALISVDHAFFKYQLLVLPLMYAVFIRELFRNRENPFTNIGFTILGIIYIALPFTLLVYIIKPGLSGEYKPLILLGYFFLIWVFDSGAYLVGSNFGKHKMFPKISPKKSWEGAVGGTVFTIMFAYLLSLYVDDLRFVDWVVIGLIVVVIGTIGDLVESLLKRSVGIKDSGNIMPGHGGILDRFDSILISSPFVFVYLNFI